VNPISIKAEIMFGALLMSIGGAGGYAAALKWGVNAVSAARSDTAVCTSIDGAKQAAIDNLTGRLKDLQTRHDAMREAADKGLKDRDTQIASLKEKARKRASAITESPHDQECTALERLPLCPGIARELWPAAAPAADPDAPAGH